MAVFELDPEVARGQDFDHAALKLYVFFSTHWGGQRLLAHPSLVKSRIQSFELLIHWIAPCPAPPPSDCLRKPCATSRSRKHFCATTRSGSCAMAARRFRLGWKPSTPPAPGSRWRCTSSTTTRSVSASRTRFRSEEHTSELQSPCNLVC